MVDMLKKFEDELAFQKAKRGEGTGPISRILSNVSILILVYLLVVLFKDQLYIPALILLILGFTSFGHWVALGTGVYFIFIGYWTGVILMAIFFVVGWMGAWAGMRNIKKNLYTGKAKIDPFEGVGDLIFILIFQIIFLVLALMTSGILSVIFWVLFALVILYQAGRFYHRLSTPWRRVHFPLMFRYASIAGYQTGIAERVGKEFNIKEVLREFARNIYPNWSDEEINEFLISVNKKREQFTDRKSLAEAFKKANPNINPDKLEEVLNKIERALKNSNEKGLWVRWLISEVIERDYGKAERIKYLQAVITGQAY